MRKEALAPEVKKMANQTPLQGILSSKELKSYDA